MEIVSYHDEYKNFDIFIDKNNYKLSKQINNYESVFLICRGIKKFRKLNNLKLNLSIY